VSGITGTAEALLIDNNDGTVTQIRSDGSVLMWLQNANYVNQAWVTGGLMDWNEANIFVAYLNNTNYLGHSDWRLPSTLVNGVLYDLTWSTNVSTD